MTGCSGRRRSAAALLAAALVAALTSCAPTAPVRFHLAVATAPIDEPIGARISGLPAGASVEVAAVATDDSGTTWRSRERMRASATGVVELGAGRDPGSPLESMRPDDAAAQVFEAPTGGFDIRLAVVTGGRTVATAIAHRSTPASAGVRTHPLSVAGDGVHGTLFLPPLGAPRAPGLLLFGGSGGGEEYDGVAAQLAAHGYPVLSLAYFGASDLPPTLDRIPLEYFVRALHVLRARPEVDPAHLVVLGASRGSEAALLLGIHEPGLVAGVIAVDPTDHANVAEPSGTGAAWTLHGAPVPTAPATDIGIADPADAPTAVFDTARIRGPLLTLCGEGDQVWPSCSFAGTLRARRGAARVGDRFVAYPGAGHGIGVLESILPRTVQPWAGGDLVIGGTVEGDQAAITAAHLEVLRFLRAQADG